MIKILLLLTPSILLALQLKCLLLKVHKEIECIVVKILKEKSKYSKNPCLIEYKLANGKLFKIALFFINRERKNLTKIVDLVTLKYIEIIKNSKARFSSFLRGRCVK